MTNDDVRTLMRECYDKLLSTYPFREEGSNIDARLAYAMGLAAGALHEGLEAERDNRPMRTRGFLPTEAERHEELYPGPPDPPGGG
jgi:hypothetical protein